MKVRRIDYSADEFLVGTRALTDAECGVYWRACSLVYSHGGPVPIAELRRWCSSRKKDFEAILDLLVGSGKLTRKGDEFSQTRAERELERATKRTEAWRNNGPKGGRPSKKIKELEKPSGFAENNHSSNYQLSTINQEEKPSLSGGKKPLKQKQEVPEDWLPDDGDRAFAEERAGWVGQRLDDEVGAFRDYHRKEGNLFADVSAAWRTWVRNGAKFQAERGNTRRGAAPPAVEALPLAYDEDEQWRARLRSWIDPARGGPTRRRWIDSVWGPPPGQPGCKVPHKLLQELQFSEWEAA